MSAPQLFSGLLAIGIRWIRLVPALFRHDPLFRYATIAAVLALIFLAVGIGRQIAGFDAVSPMPETAAPAGTGTKNGKPQGDTDTADDAEMAGPPAPGSPAAPSATKGYNADSTRPLARRHRRRAGAP